MNRDPDLFPERLEPRYPRAAGYKVSGPSREAARKVEPYAKTVRGRVLQFFRDRHPGGATSDEAARALGLSGFTVRPRLTELNKTGLLEPTPERRANDSGHLVTVWRATAAAMREAA